MRSLINVLGAVVIGVGGVVTLFWVLNFLAERLPAKWEDRVKPYVFIGPAVLVVSIFLLYPAIDTIIRSFQNADSTEFVGMENYTYLMGNRALRGAIWNNILWIVLVPTVAVAVGLAVAVLADKLKPRWENTSKSMIFLPMAISFVGASTIWGFVYAWRPENRPQIGILNAIVSGAGGTPIPFLQNPAMNDFALIAIMIWLQAGFAMVLLSAAIKNVPEDTLEAARIDGASEMQVFWRVVVPQIRSTTVVVATTILILVLKVFDIVFVMTNGNFGTEVVASLFIKELFTNFQFGRAAAIVVFLMLVTIPFMILNIRRFREQEATR